MIAVLDDNQWIYLNNLTTQEDEVLWVEFSVVKPGQYIDPAQRGNWDGIYRKYNRGRQRLARPFLSMLRGVCAKNDLPLSVRDNRPSWPYQIVPVTEIGKDFLPGITLDDFQVDCIRRATQIECGIIDVPTGGGKTELIAGFCKAIQCPTLILADQRIVIDQLKARLELRDVADEIGLFYAGKRPNGQLIVVGSIQSLTPPTKPPDVPSKNGKETDAAFLKRMDAWDKRFKAYKTRRENAKSLQQYVKKAEMIIVDECDRATSDPWKNLFRHYFRGRRRYGLSGTPFDPEKPVEALVVQEHLGSLIFRETRETLTKLGRIIPCEYFMLAYGLEGDIHEASAYDIAYNEHITESVDFHAMVAKLCRKCKREDGDGTLVLVDREALGVKLEVAINNLGLTACFIYGKTPQRRRNEVLRSFEARKIDVLIGGKIINRGLDLCGGCENLILACGGRLQSDFIQKVGRAVRVNRRGKSKVYDFFFRCNRYLYSHSKARLKTMIHAGYRTTVVFPGGGIDGTELLKSRFHIKRKLLVPRAAADGTN
jgi:superfamily II DNA or RNA helicase